MSLTWRAHWQRLKGHIFKSDDNVQEAKIQQFRQQPKECFADWIHKLEHEWDSCLYTCGGISHSVVLSPITGKKVEFFLSVP